MTLPRVPVLAAAMASMAAGAWLGLVRIGWNVPLPWPDRLVAHGPLMVCGFLGTLIALERAVALRSNAALIVPALAATAATAIAVSSSAVGPLLVTAASAGLLAMFAVFWRREPSLFVAVMAGGAAMFAAGNALWLGGAPIFRIVWWWAAFLVLTIAGERLELNRVLRPGVMVRALFVASTGATAAGVALSSVRPDSGVRLAGVGLVALAAWLARFDVARRTIRQGGLTRYMAASLLAGYGWLAFGGAIAALTAAAASSLLYDAALHAIFLGFVMSMVFAHAPVIFPAVLGRPLPYRPAFYAHVVVLHASVILRVVGDLVDILGRWRVWGGLLNAVALAIFVANMVGSGAGIGPASVPVRRGAP